MAALETFRQPRMEVLLGIDLQSPEEAFKAVVSEPKDEAERIRNHNFWWFAGVNHHEPLVDRVVRIAQGDPDYHKGTIKPIYEAGKALVANPLRR